MGENIFKIIFYNKRYITSLIIRFAIIIVTEVLYYKYDINYTDIDYHVFSDGAKHVAKLESPYKRETYRYTPILAAMMVPNIKIWYPIGKFILSTIDVGVGYLIECLLLEQENKNYLTESDKNLKAERRKKLSFTMYGISTLFYLYNPLTFVISTRGSADCIVTFLVLLSLLLLEKKKYCLSAICYGFSVHFKIYPIIYAPAIILYLMYNLYIKEQNKYNTKKNISSSCLSLVIEPIKMGFKYVFSKVIILYIFLFLGVFFFFLALFYKLIGFKFLYEYLLYHLIRKDHRHNYSIFYYTIYLTYDNDFSKYLSLVTFLPQIILILIVTLFLYKDINLCLIVLTMIFVHFNKVITSQYFVWYLSLIPLIIHRNKLFLNDMFKLIIIFTHWVTFEVLWNPFSHDLESLGENTFMQMWVVNIIFFLLSCYFTFELTVNTKHIEAIKS